MSSQDDIRPLVISLSQLSQRHTFILPIIVLYPPSSIVSASPKLAFASSTICKHILSLLAEPTQSCLDGGVKSLLALQYLISTSDQLQNFNYISSVVCVAEW